MYLVMDTNNASAPPASGEIWLVAPRTAGTAPGMVAVMETGCRHLSVLVADNEHDQATDRDLCFEAGVATPWTLRVCGDLVGPVRRTAFLRRVGALPANVTAQLRLLGYLGEVHDAVRPYITGIRLRGPDDPRWAWLIERSELADAEWFAPIDDIDEPECDCPDGPCRFGSDAWRLAPG